MKASTQFAVGTVVQAATEIIEDGFEGVENFAHAKEGDRGQVVDIDDAGRPVVAFAQSAVTCLASEIRIFH